VWWTGPKRVIDRTICGIHWLATDPDTWQSVPADGFLLVPPDVLAQREMEFRRGGVDERKKATSYLENSRFR
jgi:hypothetical protein